MEIDNGEISPVAQRKPFILLRIWRYLITAFYSIFALLIAAEWSRLKIPGAPVNLYWSTVALLFAISIAHAPPVFFRLGNRLKVLAYIAAVSGLIMAGMFIGQIQSAYERTPQGAKEAAIEAATQAKLDAKDIEKRKMDAKAAQLEKQQQQRVEFENRLKACLSWDGRMPAFELAVQSRLHNPKAFEHVTTQLIDDDEEERNIAMEFRAENAFGAIRTGTVKAKLSSETCEVSNLSELATE
jgi:hypothetical protein